MKIELGSFETHQHPSNAQPLRQYFAKEETMKQDPSGAVRLATRIQNAVKRGTLATKGCAHLTHIQNVIPSSQGCEDCLKIGDEWVHLRLCLTCGHVGCCDDSKNKHATRHFQETGHPMIASYEEDEYWIWCYSDNVGFDLKKQLQS